MTYDFKAKKSLMMMMMMMMMMMEWTRPAVVLKVVFRDAVGSFGGSTLSLTSV